MKNEELISAFLNKIRKGYNDEDFSKIRQAAEYADEKHGDQMRKSGEPYTESINQQSDLLSQMMGRLNVVFERYPELKASDLYKEAQEGMKQYEENVRMSRMIYNDTATKMNRMVRQWPSSIVASLLHFDQKDYLKVDDEKKKTYPDLDEAFKK